MQEDRKAQIDMDLHQLKLENQIQPRYQIRSQ